MSRRQQIKELNDLKIQIDCLTTSIQALKDEIDWLPEECLRVQIDEITHQNRELRRKRLRYQYAQGKLDA